MLFASDLIKYYDTANWTRIAQNQWRTIHSAVIKIMTSMHTRTSCNNFITTSVTTARNATFCKVSKS